MARSQGRNSESGHLSQMLRARSSTGGDLRLAWPTGLSHPQRSWAVGLGAIPGRGPEWSRRE